jgi:hypothetical protein
MSFFGPSLITEKQKEYITILSSYASTKKLDKTDMRNYLEKVKKTDVSQLSRKEGSEFIQILLQRPTEYEFPCGIKSILPKKEVNAYSGLGHLEGCLHACPENFDVNSCEYWKAHMDE